MKTAKSLSIVLLALLLLLTGCGQNRQEELPEAETEETDWEEIFPFQDFPADGDSKESANTGTVTPIRMEDSIFRAKFEGSKVAGSGEVVDGVYRFKATKTDREAWHVKLECNYPTVAGRDYFVTYKFNSDVAGKVKFGDFQEFQIHKGENSITGVMIATGGTSYLDLQLGMLSPFTIDFTEIEVKEYEDEASYENVLPVPINFERESLVYEKHDSGYTTILIRRDDTVNVNYLSAPLDSGVWKSRLYVRTGLFPEPGVSYRVSADMMCDEDMPFELLFNNGDEEKGYGAVYDQKVSANKVKKIEAVVTGNGNVDELVLQLSLGEAPDGSKVVFGNVKVEKITDGYVNVLPEGFRLDESAFTGRYINRLIPRAFENIPLSLMYDSVDTVYEQHDDGYIVELDERADKALLWIKQAPAKEEDRGVWKVRLYAATGVDMKVGQTYRLKFNLTATRDQADYEVCFDGNNENEYGVLYGRSLKAGETDQVEQLITPDYAGGPLTIRLQLGKTDTAAGNLFTLSGLKLETVEQDVVASVLPDDFSYDTQNASATYVNVLPDDFSYNTLVNVSEQHDDGYVQSVSADGDSAVLNIEQAPESDRGVWKSKLLIRTGVTPEAGTKYLVRFDIMGENAQSSYEVCFDGNEEKSYGALYGLSMDIPGETKTIRHVFVPEESDGELVIRFQLGNTDDSSGNIITVKNLKIAALTLGDNTESVLPDDFAYPTVTTVVPDEEGYVPVTLPEPGFSESHDTGFDQSVEGTSLKINQVHNLWESKLFVNTNTKLEANTKYRITANLTSEKAFDFEIDYNRDSEEKGFGGLYGQSIGEGESKDFVFETEANLPEGNLTLQFMVGKSPASNTITVNSVKLEKYIPGHQETIEVPDTYENVDVSISASHACDDDYNQTLEGTSLTIHSVSENPGVWKSKLFIDSGKQLESGKKYKATVKVRSEKAIDLFEICYNRNDEEKGFDAEYGLNIGEESKTIVKEINASESGKLVLQFQLGLSPAENVFTVESFKLEEFVPAHQEEVQVDGAYENVGISQLTAWQEHDTGFDQSVEGTSLKINQVHNLWESKLFVNTNTKLEANTKYRITANLTSEKAFDFEIDYNRDSEEKGFGGLYGQSIGEGESKDFVFETEANLPEGNLTLQFMVGKSPASNTITVNNIVLEKKTDSQDPIETVDSKSFELWAHEDYKTVLKGDGSSASVDFENAPDSPADAWKTKLIAHTGAKLEEGKTYRISADVAATSDTSYEICYSDSNEEKGFGASYDLSASQSAQTVTYDVTADHTDFLNIQFSIGKSAKGSKVTVSNIKVEEFKEVEGDNLMSDPLCAWAPVHQWMDGGYSGALSNDDSSATLRLDTVSSDPADWKVKLFVETGAALEKDKEYRISYVLNADEEVEYNIFYNNGAEEKAVGDFYDLKTGSSEVQHTVTPSQDAELVIQLMLGKSPASNNITISGIKVEELVSGSANPPINSWTHEDYVTSLSNTDDSATLTIESVPSSGREAWKVKLFAETGAKLEAGKTYRISVDVQSESTMGYEICYNNGGAERELGSKTGLVANSSKKTIVFNATPDNEAELVIQFNLGKAAKPNSFTISNVKVEEADVVSAKNLLSGFRYDSVAYFSKASDDGYITSLKQYDSFALFKIKHAPEERNPWNAKVIVRTGFTPETGKGYRVNVDIDSTKSQGMFEIFYDGNSEMAYGALYEQRLPAGNKTFSYIIMPGESKGELVLQLRFGKTDGTDGNSYIINNVSVEEVTFTASSTPEISNVTELVSQSGYVTEIDKMPDRATIRLIKTPKNGREAWKNKLFINTGVTLKEGEKYRIRATVKSIIPAPFEVCLNDGDVEKGLGGIFGLMSRPQGEYISYAAYLKEDVDLVVQLSLGNCVAPNTITLSDLKVEKAGKINLVSDKIYSFR